MSFFNFIFMEIPQFSTNLVEDFQSVRSKFDLICTPQFSNSHDLRSKIVKWFWNRNLISNFLTIMLTLKIDLSHKMTNILSFIIMNMKLIRYLKYILRRWYKCIHLATLLFVCKWTAIPFKQNIETPWKIKKANFDNFLTFYIFVDVFVDVRH